jgi:hypothetical protein
VYINYFLYIKILLGINSDHILQFIIVHAHSIDWVELLFHAAAPTYGVAAFLI